MSIFAGTQGYLDDLSVDKVLAFEKALLQHVRDEFPEVLTEIAEKGELSDELSQTIGKIITDFKVQFNKKSEG